MTRLLDRWKGTGARTGATLHAKGTSTNCADDAVSPEFTWYVRRCSPASGDPGAERAYAGILAWPSLRETILAADLGVELVLHPVFGPGGGPGLGPEVGRVSGRPDELEGDDRWSSS
jgi:hypothetical protein